MTLRPHRPAPSRAGAARSPTCRDWLLLAAAVVLVLAAGSASVLAQLLPELPPLIVPETGDAAGVTVQSRLRPAYEPQGIRAGPLRFQALVEASAGFDSGVLGANGGASPVLRTHPSLGVTESGAQHDLGLRFDLTETRFTALPAQDRVDFTAAGAAAIALGIGRLDLGAAHLSLHQQPTDIDALPADRPTPYSLDEVHLGLARTWNRLTVEPGLSFAVWRFGAALVAGRPASQAYRDRDVLQASLTAHYELAPRREVLVAVRTALQDYTASPAGSASPDSHALSLLAGIDDATDGLWHYRLLAGWEHRGFRSTLFHAHDALVGEADMIVTPGGMTTLTASLSRSIEDAAQEGVAGFVYTAARLVVDYEWRRNVLLQASGGVQWADLLGSASRQRIVRSGVSTTWLLNRHLRLIGSYDFAVVNHVASGGALGGGFLHSLALLTVRAGL